MSDGEPRGKGYFVACGGAKAELLNLPAVGGLHPGPALGPGPVLDTHLVQGPALFPDVERTKPYPVELVPHLCDPSRASLRHVHVVPHRAVRVAHRSRGVFGELGVKEPGKGCGHQGAPGPSLGRDLVEPGSGHACVEFPVPDPDVERHGLVRDEEPAPSGLNGELRGLVHDRIVGA